MSYLYQQLIFRPLYNGLVGLMDLLPWIDIGVAVVIFTIIVKIILFPLAKSSIMTQIRMKDIEPEAAKIRAEYKDNKQAQALAIMQLYKEKKIKPFSGILLLLLQLPILLALLSVFYKIIPTIDPEFLYSFVSIPVIKTEFLGLIDLTHKSLVLALLTGVLQYLQIHFSPAYRQSRLTAVQAANKPGTGDFQTQLATSMNKQLKFMLPLIAFASVYWLIPSQFPQAASIIAIYWSTSTLFTLVQELFVRRRYMKV